MIDPALRGSAAHVLVVDVAAPTPTPDAVHHLLRVLRLRDGEAVTVTDGNGRWRECVIAGASIEPTGDARSVERPEPA